MALLEYRNVSKTYGERDRSLLALDGVNLCVGQGEFVSIVGPSGCGKSTLLYLAAGFEELTSGELLLDGVPVSAPGRDRGMVFQDYSLFPWLTVRENALFYFSLGSNKDVGESVERSRSHIEYADYLLDIMGLGDFPNRYPRELSSGMKQRAALARTLAPRPKIVLMDEPFSALDAQTREQMQELLYLLKMREKMTVLFVTHDVEEAIYLSDRVIAMSHRPGRVLDERDVTIGGQRDLDIKESVKFMELKHYFIHLIRTQSEPSFDREALKRKLDAQDR